MRIPRLYFDTSVFGGIYDIEFQNETALLFEMVMKGKIICVYSDMCELELENAPEKVVGETSIDDCRHIACATINKVDFLVSWNFKHIVNIFRIRGYNAINIKNGYGQIDIRSPKDIIGND